MIIGHSRPTAATWTVSGTGAAILADQFDAGRPDMLSRLRWLSGTQTTASVLRLRADWTTAIVPGLLHLAGGGLPVGTKIEVAWRRAGDAAGTYPYLPAAWANPQRVVAGIRGERLCTILVKPGATPAVGCEVRIYNDVSGSPAIPASAEILLGAVIPCAATEVDIDADWSIDLVDPTADNPTALPYRSLSFAWAADDQETILGTRAQLLARIDRQRRSVYIPRHLDAAGQFDVLMTHRTALIGMLGKPPGARHATGPYFTSSVGNVTEVPVPT